VVLSADGAVSTQNLYIRGWDGSWSSWDKFTLSTTAQSSEEEQGATGQTINGTEENDELIGGSGDDIINALAGNDNVNAGGGNDTIYTGSGDDQILGGEGDDKIIQSGSGTQFYDGGEGIDTVELDFSIFSFVNLNPEYANIVEIDFKNGIIGQVGNENKRDTFTNIENASIVGDYSFSINVVGDEKDNVISGGSGNDHLIGGQGNDVISTGAGNDTVFAGSGNDIIIQNGSGEQYLDGGEGIDLFELDTSFVSTLNENYPNSIEINLKSGLVGQTNNPNLKDKIVSIEDVLFKGDYDVIITGDDHTNVLIGDNGNDTFYTGAGDDRIYGNDGNDKIVVNGTGSQFYDGGEGNDTIEINASWLSSLSNNYPYKVEIDLLNGTSGQINNLNFRDSFISIENASFLGEFDVIITGSDENNILSGGNGDDILRGNKGDDIFEFMGKGNDVISDTGGTETLKINFGADKIWQKTYREGNDFITEGKTGKVTFVDAFSADGLEYVSWFSGEYEPYKLCSSNDISSDGPIMVVGTNTGENIEIGDNFAEVYAGSGDDTIVAGSGVNWIFGFDGNDVITAGGGDDYVAGGSGNDLISLGAGSDTVIFSEINNGTDEIIDFQDNDKLDFSDILSDGDFVNAISGNDILLASHEDVANQNNPITISNNNIYIAEVAQYDKIVSSAAVLTQLFSGGGLEAVNIDTNASCILVLGGEDKITQQYIYHINNDDNFAITINEINLIGNVSSVDGVDGYSTTNFVL
ncbi:MAG: calcium-binding protein, partial [Paracoccaceae bacterium]